ncbi:EmrB/QacA subfamily drug resistance transporter [Paenibacillus taihuensis]|uniref:EmrB/QacA subfamily drug resistance transporter n=1 Tax=Paenibacillus taihuensis TaxID=1156355 RepID=A0A3D9SC78_9BACL|nr:MFS transporter [Paenibacillus taihuensis]REE91504.1 EmrB/QacA subfamily drug resistance transporter [Paenibacillus taihuensis]
MLQPSHLMNYGPPESIAARKGYHWFVVATVCIGAFMAALDASIINLALPSLVSQLHVSMAKVEWISLVYLLTLASLVIPFGRLADMLGRRWMYASGFMVFLISSLFCGMAPTFSVLLAARIVQAVGAAMLQANSVAIITSCTPAHHRGKAIGIQASAQGIGLSLGPVIGGALLTMGDWRWLFYINIPIGVVGTILGFLLLPRDSVKKKESFDLWGMLFLLPFLIFLLYILNDGVELGWSSPIILLGSFTCLLALTSFIREEHHAKMPLMDLSLFRNKVFIRGNITSFLSFAVMYGVLLLSPFLMENVFHLKATTAGVYLSFVPIGMTLLTPIAGYLSDRLGPRLPVVIGMITVFAGCSLLASIHSEHANLQLMFGLGLVGSGMGLFTPPNNSNVMGSTPSNRLGIAGATLNMSRTIGMGMGITLGGALYQMALQFMPGSVNFTAFRVSFVFLSLIALVGLVIACIRQPNPIKYDESFIEYYI